LCIYLSLFRHSRKIGRNEQYPRLNSDNSRSDHHTIKSQHHSLLVGGARGLNSSHKRYRPEEHSEDKGRLIAKGDSVSNSMSRMIRSSPKIHVKQHIHNQSAASSIPRGNASTSNRFHSKLHLNRVAVDNGSMDDSRNQKLESILNKHVMQPVDVSSRSHSRSN
jgi:hypothetical protein